MKGTEYRYVGRSWMRVEKNAAGYWEGSWCTGRDDVSRDTRGIHGNSAGSEYDSRCGWCFLGAAHTIDEHNSELAEHAARHKVSVIHAETGVNVGNFDTKELAQVWIDQLRVNPDYKARCYKIHYRQVQS